LVVVVVAVVVMGVEVKSEGFIILPPFVEYIINTSHHNNIVPVWDIPEAVEGTSGKFYVDVRLFLHARSDSLIWIKVCKIGDIFSES
jgi:hypothetical protein